MSFPLTKCTLFLVRHSLRGRQKKLFKLPRIKDAEIPEEEEPADQSNKENISEPHSSPKSSNTILFPSTEDPSVEPNPAPNDKMQQLSCSQRTRHQKGHYKTLNKGLVAAITAFVEEVDDDIEIQLAKHPEQQSEDFYKLPPNIVLIRYSATDPKMLDEALQGSNAKKWQEALEYEINQLKKLGTRVVQDLPQGHMPIPCSKVVRVKQGPDSEVQSYRVRIVAGGHRQVKE